MDLKFTGLHGRIFNFFFMEYSVFSYVFRQPEHGGLAFNLPRGQAILEKWNQIPEDVDILVTHGPPLGHGDRLISGGRAGCVELLSTIQKRVKPKFHIFGHIHEGTRLVFLFTFCLIIIPIFCYRVWNID